MSFSIKKNNNPAYVFNNSSLWSQSGNNIYNNNTGGKVGINNSNPIYTFDISTSSTDSMRIQSPTYVGVVYENNNNNVNIDVSTTVVYQLDCTARRANTQSTIYRCGVIYNGNGTDRRGKYVAGVAETSTFGAFQSVMTQVGTNKVNILGQNASTYNDNGVDPNTAYNIHASNIINCLSSSTLGLLSLDVEGITKHKFFSNGNVTFGGTTNNANAIVDISSTTKGFMPPRMTGAQAVAIPTTAADAGLMVYATSASGAISAPGWWGWNGTTWTQLG